MARHQRGASDAGLGEHAARAAGLGRATAPGARGRGARVRRRRAALESFAVHVVAGRGLRAGGWFQGNNRQAAGRFFSNQEMELSNIGFRVVKLTE